MSARLPPTTLRHGYANAMPSSGCLAASGPTSPPAVPTGIISCAVKSAFCWGEVQGYIATNPVRRVKVPPQVPRGDEAYLEPDQWTKVVACDDPNLLDLLDVLTVLYETGCRPQELRRVESRHYDRAARTWDFVVEESKGKRDRRTVLLSDAAFEICQRLAEASRGADLSGPPGKPWTATALDRECEKLSKLVGFHLTPYMVRHTFATRKILAGVDLISIAALMGHRNLTTLSRVYAHVMRRQDHLRAALKEERVTPQAALPQAVLPQVVLPHPCRRRHRCSASGVLRGPGIAQRSAVEPSSIEADTPAAIVQGPCVRWPRCDRH